MNYTIKQRVGLGRLVFGHFLAGAAVASALFAGVAHAAGEVSEIQTIDQPGTPTEYEIDGVTFRWGMGQNQVMVGFTAHNQTFHFASAADRVELIRFDAENVSTGNPCGVFVERLSASYEVLKANYPSDGSGTGNCDMAAMLASRVVNRGALDLFSNTGPHPKNVERVDYLYDHGLLAPLSSSALAQSGHVVAEKRGNNPLQIAAITKIDILGQPLEFGPLVLVDRNGCSGDTICYGVTNLRHNYSFFQNNSFAPQGYPSYLRDSTESVGMAFISLEKLGLQPGQIYHGFSYFADDVDASVHTLTDVSTFPLDTNDEKILFGDGPDIYGGVSGYFLSDNLSVASGTVYKDEDRDGLFDEDEAGISAIGLSLYVDTNGDGVLDLNEDTQVGPTFDSDVNGEFRIPGLENGLYFLFLSEADPDLPPAISLAQGSNPSMIIIQGNDADGINFGFISDTAPIDNGPGSGTTGSGTAGAGTTGSGTADSGTTGSGTADSGTADSGTTGSGTTGSGTADPGTTGSGTTDTGTTGSGTAGPGTADSGTTGSGTTDSGTADSGTTGSGTTDMGTTGSGTADSGTTDSGTTGSGTTDTGTTDSGTLDAGVNDPGTDGGATDSGTDAGTTDSGTTDVGTTAGTTGGGTTDSGTTDTGTPDTGTTGGATTGNGTPDTGTTGGATTGNGTPDTGTTDGATTGNGTTDSGTPDVGTTAGTTGDGTTDSGTPNSGIPDNGTTGGGTTNGETVANADSVTVRRGDVVTIDVLANDIDGVGDGLTIISTSDTPNAVITIQDGGVLYTPNFGYSGLDSFLYVIEDSAGMQSTGTVRVNVLFSDINKNGRNDYEECNCDNLTIEVGVEGSALGGSSLITFLILSLIFGFRQIVRSGRSDIAGVFK